MGRGRAKAKQTKVARDLKYNSGGTDLERLKAELAGGSPAPLSSATAADDDELADDADDRDLDDDPYAPDGTAGR